MHMVPTDGAKKKSIFEIDVILACNINFTFTEYKHCPHRSVNAWLPRPICTLFMSSPQYGLSQVYSFDTRSKK